CQVCLQGQSDAGDRPWGSTVSRLDTVLGLPDLSLLVRLRRRGAPRNALELDRPSVVRVTRPGGSSLALPPVARLLVAGQQQRLQVVDLVIVQCLDQPLDPAAAAPLGLAARLKLRTLVAQS